MARKVNYAGLRVADKGMVEHPMEIARQALITAAAVEPEWSDLMLRFAYALPARGPINKGDH